MICFLCGVRAPEPVCSRAHFLLSPCRLAETTVVYPADVVLFEGILVFYSQEIRDMFHLRLFVDTDSDVRLSRRGKAGSASLPRAEARRTSSGLKAVLGCCRCSSPRCEPREGPGADPDPVHHLRQARL